MAGYGELEAVPATPAEEAEGYAREWELWADAIREFPEITRLGRPGSPDFDRALDAALDLLDGGFADEIDEDLDSRDLLDED